MLRPHFHQPLWSHRAHLHRQRLPLPLLRPHLPRPPPPLLTKLTSIGNGFLNYCYALTSLDLSGLTKLTTIGDYFLYYCNGLTSLDLSPLTKLTSIGTNFLSNCFALTSITVGDTNFTNTTIGNSSMSNVTNLSSNKIYGSKAAEFKIKIGANISN
jgi:hypothetical protein